MSRETNPAVAGWLGLVAGGYVALAAWSIPTGPPRRRGATEDPAARVLAALERAGASRDTGRAVTAFLDGLGPDPKAWLGAYEAPPVPGRFAWEALHFDPRGRAELARVAPGRLDAARRALADANRVAALRGRPPLYPLAGPAPAGGLPQLWREVAETAPPAGARARLLEGRLPGAGGRVAAAAARLFRAAIRAGHEEDAVVGETLGRALRHRFRALAVWAFVSPRWLEVEAGSGPWSRAARAAIGLAWLARAEFRQALAAPDPAALKRAQELLAPGVPAPADPLGVTGTEAAALVFGLAGRADLAARACEELRARAPAALRDRVGAEWARFEGRDATRPGAAWPPATSTLAVEAPEIPAPHAPGPRTVGAPESPPGAPWRYRPPAPGVAARFRRTRRPKRGSGG